MGGRGEGGQIRQKDKAVQVGEFGSLNYGLFSWLESWPQLLKKGRKKTAAAPPPGTNSKQWNELRGLFFVK